MNSGYLQIENYHNIFIGLPNTNMKYLNFELTYLPVVQWKIILQNNNKCNIITSDDKYSFDIYNLKNPYLLAYKYSNSINQIFNYKYISNNKIQIWHESNPNNIGFNNLPYLILNIISENNLCNIICFNLGYNVILNQVYGSEKSLVSKCQKEYNVKGREGWNKKNILSQCSANAMKFLEDNNADLFGLQEVPPNKWVNLQNYFDNIINKKFEYFIGYGIIIGSNLEKLGNGIQITPTNFYIGTSDKRGMMAVFYPNRGWIVINAHLPHNIDIVKLMNERIKNYIEPYLIQIGYGSKDVKRVIIMGDFNDFQGNMNNKYITAFGKKVQLPNFDIPLTCCDDTNYKFPGDYILDTDLNTDIYFGIPPSYVRYKPLMSDHDPVMLLAKFTD